MALGAGSTIGGQVGSGGPILQAMRAGKSDTPREVESLIVDGYRRMTPREKLERVSQLESSFIESGQRGHVTSTCPHWSFGLLSVANVYHGKACSHGEVC
jgi:hypothetical protein